MGLGALDKVAYDVSKQLLGQFGGTGKVEIVLAGTGGDLNGAISSSTTTFDNIDITPSSPYIQDSQTDTPIASGNIETYVHASQVTTEPIANSSFLTVYRANFDTSIVTNKRMKIVEVNPIMGGNSIAMYQLICEGSH